MSTNIKQLRDDRAAALEAARAIQATAKAEDNRPVTDEELEKIQTHTADAKRLREEIAEAEEAETKRLAAIAALDDEAAEEQKIQKPIGRVDPTPLRRATPATPATVATPNEHSFASFGEQLQAVALASKQHPSQWDKRLVPHGAISGMNETVGSQGGFLVGTDVMTGLLQRMYENNQILNGGAGYSGPTRVPISANANSVKLKAVNESSRANGSRFGGVRAYWIEEAGSKTASQPDFREMELSLKKLIGLYYATDELLQDAAALESLCFTWFAQEFAFKVQDALYNGTGAGMPLGILPAACLVSQAKETGQVAATIVKENIDKMWSRMWASGIPNSVWHINQQCYPQLFSLTQAVGTGGMPVYLPPGGLSQSPYGTLMGRPVVPIEQAPALGTVGDISFCDWSQMLFADKGGIQAASSIHVRFLYDESVFRFVYRCDAQPAWDAALTPFTGGATATTGPFVVLATRS